MNSQMWGEQCGVGSRACEPTSMSACLVSPISRQGRRLAGRTAHPTLLLLLLCSGLAHAQDSRQIIQEVQKRQASKSQRYEGTLEVIGGENRVATKRWVYQRIGDFGNSKAILRFTVPADVKGVGLLIVNHTDRASDQWMWRPSIGRDQRIALQDRSTRFFGTDFSFEDLEERDVDQFDFKLLADEGTAWKIETRPRKSSQYTYSYEWVKKDNYTVVKIEAYNKKGLLRVIDYKDYQQVKGIWTPLTTEVLDVPRKSRTILKYDKVDFNMPMKEDDFTLQALRRES